MYQFGYIRRQIPFNENEIEIARQALRDALLCMGWMKMFGSFMYICLYFLVQFNAQDDENTHAIKILCLICLVPTLLMAIFMIMGALQEKLCCIVACLWLLIITAVIDTALGVFGGIYFMRFAKRTSMFLLSLLFWLLLFSFCRVLCDLPVVNTYRILLAEHLANPRQESHRPPPPEPLAITQQP